MDVRKTLTYVEGEISKNMTHLDKLAEELNSRIQGIIDEKLKRKLNEYDRVAQGFSKFFNQDQLWNIIDSKIDH